MARSHGIYAHAVAALVLVLSVLLANTAFGMPAGVAEMQRAMIQTVVKVEAHDGRIGSGVIISSVPHGSVCETLIVTNKHVVTDRPAVTVRTIIWWQGVPIGYSLRAADVVADDEANDLALLRLRDAPCVEAVADMAAPDAPLYPGEVVYAVGAGLGFDPFLTAGLLSIPDASFRDRTAHLHSAATIFGNSGGALFHAKEGGGYDLIGIVSAVAMAPIGGNMMGGQAAVAHMGFAIPMRAVHKFLASYRIA